MGKVLIRQRKTFSVFTDLIKDVPSAAFVGIKLLEKLCHYILSEEDMHIMLQNADASMTNERSSVPFPARDCYKEASVLFDESHGDNLKQGKKQFSTFVLFPETKIQQSKSFSYLFLSFSLVLFVYSSTMQERGQRSKRQAEV